LFFFLPSFVAIPVKVLSFSIFQKEPNNKYLEELKKAQEQAKS